MVRTLQERAGLKASRYDTKAADARSRAPSAGTRADRTAPSHTGDEGDAPPTQPAFHWE